MLSISNFFCTSCNFCLSVCPRGAIYQDVVGNFSVNNLLCNLCFNCVECCPANSISSIPSGGSTNPYSGNILTLLDQSKNKWFGTPYLLGCNSISGIDCSHLVNQIYSEIGLPFSYASTSMFNQLVSDGNFIRVSIPQGGEIILWKNHHMGIYVENPGVPGYNIYSATSHGVREGSESWWTEIYGSPTYFRKVQQVNPE